MSVSSLTLDLPEDTADTLWRSLRAFHIYRLAAASLFFALVLAFGTSLAAAAPDRALFLSVNSAYWLLALGFVALQGRRWWSFDMELTLAVIVDVVALTLLMHASGGLKSGFGFLLLVALSAAALVGHGRLAFFFAALGTVAVLLEQAYRVLAGFADAADFLPAALTGTGFFASALIARLLARRAIENAQLARRRGAELANQLWIGERIIRDMQDGVLVVSAAGELRQLNPRALALLEVAAAPGDRVEAFAPELAHALELHPDPAREVDVALNSAQSGRALRGRLVAAGRAGDVLVFIEDLERVRVQARQIKLAALGRLTAGIAHEIRNPLSAITHAADLLREEKRADTQARLARIINDNAQRLERMVRDILELGRRDRAEPEALPVLAFLEAFLNELCQHEGIARAMFDLEGDARAVLAFDRGHLNQVLWNLLTNARRHCSGGGGAIVLRVCAAGADTTEIHVSDDGSGIDATHAAQLFEPFFTTSSKGTGLGLYIARELCEANHARLEYAGSAPGAHFVISGRNQP